ncbi:MAG: alpha/beta hydrolase-fold protein [Betaproteobacteria bacterium]
MRRIVFTTLGVLKRSLPRCAVELRPRAFNVLVAVVASVVFTASAEAQQSPGIAALTRGVVAGDAHAVDNFWSTIARNSSPLLEPIPGDDAHVRATFLWKDPGDTKVVVVDARFFGVDPATEPRNRMQRVPGTSIWYLTVSLPTDAEVMYQFWINPPDSGAGAPGRATQSYAIPDPLNAYTYPEKDDPLYDPSQPWRIASVARMRGAPENPWLVRNAGVARGTFTQHSIQSAHLTMANPRNVWVYTTPGAVPQRPNVLILFDGNTTYQRRIPTVAILDNLFAAHRIGPTVAIFVDNGAQARQVDLNFSDPFLSFLTDELLPWAQRQYHFTATAARTALGGDSLCGLFGAYAALRRPDVFGEVLGQSAAFQFNNSHSVVDGQAPEWIVRQFQQSPKLAVKFYLEVGLMEDRSSAGSNVTLLSSNRRLRDVLTAKGYAVEYREVYADHNPVHWRRTLPDALMQLLPPA